MPDGEHRANPLALETLKPPSSRSGGSGAGIWGAAVQLILIPSRDFFFVASQCYAIRKIATVKIETKRVCHCKKSLGKMAGVQRMKANQAGSERFVLATSLGDG